MRIEFNKYIVNKEEDFIENNINKIRTSISLIVNVVGVNNSTEMVLPLEVININTQTGIEMDEQRLKECNDLILNY